MRIYGHILWGALLAWGLGGQSFTRACIPDCCCLSPHCIVCRRIDELEERERSEKERKIKMDEVRQRWLRRRVGGGGVEGAQEENGAGVDPPHSEGAQGEDEVKEGDGICDLVGPLHGSGVECGASIYGACFEPALSVGGSLKSLALHFIEWDFALSSLANLTNLRQLSSLDLHHNGLVLLSQLSILQVLSSSLKSFTISDNPVTNCSLLPSFLLCRVPNLGMFNGVPITSEDRELSKYLALAFLSCSPHFLLPLLPLSREFSLPPSSHTFFQVLPPPNST